MNEKMKSENYQSFGGINMKASPYVMTAVEFLDLINLDFQVIGALSQRWGSTQYVSQTFGAPISALYEFSRLDGSSYLIVGTTGAIWSGATTGNAQGLSLTWTGLTTSYLFTPIGMTMAAGHTLLNSGAFSVFYQGLQTYKIGVQAQGTSMYIDPEKMVGNHLSCVSFQNYMFAADGNVFFKYDGSTVSPVGLPPPQLQSSPIYVFTTGPSQAISINQSLIIGVWASYVNRRGFEGPIWPISTISTIGATALGASYLQLSFPIFTPIAYDIASINLYTYASASLNPSNLSFWNSPFTFLSNIAAGSTLTNVPLYSGSYDPYQNQGPFPQTPDYQPTGITLQILGGVAGATNTVSEIDFVNYFPQFLEIYQNRLFSAGYSTTPSTLWFSDAGEPEGYKPDFNFEVRTNDADYLTCLKAYLGGLYVFKKNSFHVLSGDNPDNFFLQEVSSEYGCLNNRSSVVYEQSFAFLDRKGLMGFNAANIQCISTKMQPVFDTMNYSAALTNACVTHDKLRNQVLVGIPVNGATLNNLTLVYDYLLNSWTKYNGFNPSVFSTIQGRNNTKNVFYGSYSGTVNWFGPSFLSDNGSGFTTYLKSRFIHDVGDSIQKQFRRLYVNIDPPSATIVFGLNYYQDYGTSKVLSSTMVISTFQERNDFGISGKSIAFELANLQTNSPLRINGFTIESRVQRRV